jgi:nucleotide-binding universal stress UspA family protein
MLNNILVPVDGSAVGEAALPYAEALARRSGAALTLVRAAQAPPMRGDPGTAQARAIEQAESYLSTLAAGLTSRGIRVQTGVPYGAAATWITGEMALRGSDLIVMATHDRTGPSRWVRGSVAEAVVSQASVPVMVVRAAEGLRPAQGFDQPRPVLVVPLDGSTFAEAALPMAGELARVLDAGLVLVGVVPGPGQLVAAEGAVVTYVGEDFERLQAEARTYLAGVASRVGGPATEVVVRLGDPSAEIAREAAERAAAAVIMATHGRTGLVRTLLGSVAGGVLHRGGTPVVLVRPAELRPAETPVAGEADLATAGA